MFSIGQSKKIKEPINYNRRINELEAVTAEYMHGDITLEAYKQKVQLIGFRFDLQKNARLLGKKG